MIRSSSTKAADFDDETYLLCGEDSEDTTSDPTQNDDSDVIGYAYACIAYQSMPESDEMSLNVGDVIRVVEKHDMWWFGKLLDKRGWFPSALVVEVEKPEEKPAQCAH